MQCRPAIPLPAQLQAFMDSAKQGVLIVSFGSVLQASQVPPHIKVQKPKLAHSITDYKSTGRPGGSAGRTAGEGCAQVGDGHHGGQAGQRGAGHLPAPAGEGMSPLCDGVTV